MINHARTLLLNKPGAARPAPNFYLEEFVDPSFQPVTLNSGLLSSRNLLLSGGDDAYTNFRLRQLMTCIHSTEFSEYVYALDPRVTYLGKPITLATFGPSFSPMNSAAQSVPIVFEGKPTVPEPNKRLLISWRLVATSPFVVHAETLQGASKTSDTIISFDTHLSSRIELPGQAGFAIRFSAAASLPVGAEWLVTAFIAPQDDLSDLLVNLTGSSEMVQTALFKSTEPYATFKELFEKHAILTYRLAGWALAHIYSVEELRNGQ